MIKTLKRAQEVSGKLTDRNKKVPGSSFPTSTKMCGVGGKLKLVPGSTCHGCYAARLEAYRENVANGYMKNWTISQDTITKDMDLWVEGAVYQILHFYKKTGVKYHRWFDSGDAYSVEWFVAIAKVARKTPDFMHWFPTREKALYKEYLRNHRQPKNLVIRVSAAMVDGAPVEGFKNTSTVHKNKDHHGQRCIAPDQDGQCGECRACWDPKIKNISYKKH